MTDPVDTDRLRELCELATPGPWNAEDFNEGDGVPPLWGVTNGQFHTPSIDEDAPWIAVEVHVGVREDAEFIAAARAALPALLDEVDRLRDETTALGVRWQEQHDRAEAAEADLADARQAVKLTRRDRDWILDRFAARNRQVNAVRRIITDLEQAAGSWPRHIVSVLRYALDGKTH